MCINYGKIRATGGYRVTVHVLGNDISEDCSLIGGIVGQGINGKIVKAVNKGILQTANYQVAGGIIGLALRETMVKQCSNYANITCMNEQDVGGIVGYSNKATIEECFNQGQIKGKEYVGGILGQSTYTTIKNCYNMGDISGNDIVAGIVGDISPFELRQGYEYLYNCYNLGMITGTTKDPIIAKCNYLTWDYIYTTKAIHEVVGDGVWKNEAGNNNVGILTGTDAQIKQTMLTNLQKENGSGKWMCDTKGNKNNGYPYLVNNVPE